jgi:tetratricopeptide (TPR) repeat protein
VSDRARIEDLERRVQQDPTSIAFAQLAEEHRRAGDFDEAVRVCRTGLAQHPAYLSARVTLGRALMELQRYDEARTELEYVLHASPDNAAATRALADIRGIVARRTEEEQRAEAAAQAARRAADPYDGPVGPAALTASANDFAIDPDEDPFARALARLDAVTVVPPEHPVVVELERWLARIEADRDRRAGRRGA